MTTAADWELIDSHLGAAAHRTERAELAALPAMLRDVRHFVDVGASFGPFTWAAHYSLRDACITAIEANPLLCAHLQAEAHKINELGDTRGNRICIRNNAISNVTGDITFLVNAADYSTSRLSVDVDDRATPQYMKPVTVPACTLDDIFGEAAPDLIKLDVEGFEWRALDGARGILRQKKTKFLVEIHPWGDKSIQKTPRHVFDLFREHNYGVRRINHHWLFIPGRGGLYDRIQSRFYAFCVENRWVRELARRLLSKGR
jgi:FkbM family methyltransferase